MKRKGENVLTFDGRKSLCVLKAHDSCRWPEHQRKRENLPLEVPRMQSLSAGEKKPPCSSGYLQLRCIREERVLFSGISISI